jgi:hypothetical protein
LGSASPLLPDTLDLNVETSHTDYEYGFVFAKTKRR